jgi:NAD(P)-dependent dehydrogenase (short-subunit alcohol dehydrogenase family)
MNDFNRKTVAVIGAAGRIGSSLVEKLISENCNLLLADINKDKLKRLKKKFNKINIKIYTKNLCKTKNIDQFIKLGIKNFNKIDFVVHCFYPKSRQWGKKFEDINEKYLNEDLNNQLGGLIIFCQKIIERFIKQKFGNLILVSSIYGSRSPEFKNYLGTKITSPIEYTAIKAATIAITAYLAKYFKKKNIRINCVSPGGIYDKQPKKFVLKYNNLCSSKGLLDPGDLVELIIFLLSSKSQYINGQNLIIDDGYTL